MSPWIVFFFAWIEYFDVGEQPFRHDDFPHLTGKI